MSLTFRMLSKAYIAHLEGRHSHAEYIRIYQAFFENDHWGARPLEEITRFQIMRLNQDFVKIPSQGNKVVGFVKQVFQWGMDTINPDTHRPYWEGNNPAWRITRHDCFSRERVMDHAEIRLLLQTIDFLPTKYQAFFLSRLLVPCRIKELCGMRREAVDSQGKWIKKITKNGRPHTIYVAHQARTLLNALPREGEFFFMGHYDRPLTGGAVRKMWARWRSELGIKDLWLLDFRRTLATYLYRVLKVDELTAKAVLNHYDGRPVAIYVRLDYDYLAMILQGYADWIFHFKQEVHHDTHPIAVQSIADVCAGAALRPANPLGDGSGPNSIV